MHSRMKSKYARFTGGAVKNVKNVKSQFKKKKGGSNSNDKNNNKNDNYYHDDIKSNDIKSLANQQSLSQSTPHTSYYGVATLGNTKQTFGDPSFDISLHITELFASSSTSDVSYLLKDLADRKRLTSKFLSERVVHQYREFISMSRYVLEIEDQMSEMDDMLKSMSLSMKSLHSTNFGMFQNNNNNRNIIDSSAIEMRDREQQEIEVLESMHEQILQHIQLRQLQQATDLCVTAKREQIHLKQSARKRAQKFISNHIHELCALIIDQLSSTRYLPEIKRDKLSTLLMKLGFVDHAMELFLEYKSKSLKSIIRQISLYGDVKQYIRDLSSLFFDQIINTTIQYTNLLNKISVIDDNKKQAPNKANNPNNPIPNMNRKISKNPFDAFDEKKDQDQLKKDQKEKDMFSFKHSMHMSRLIVWIYAELEIYEKLFEQQVFQLEQNDFRTIGECLKIVFKQSTRLDQSGINVSFLLSNHFQPSIEAAINRLYKKKLESIKKLSRKENYISKSKNVSNAANKNILRRKRRLSVKKFTRKHIGSGNSDDDNIRNSPKKKSNPFGAAFERKRSQARHSRIQREKDIGNGVGLLKDRSNKNKNNKNKKDPAIVSGVFHGRRTSEIFGDVINVDGNGDVDGDDDDDKLDTDDIDDIDDQLLHNMQTNNNKKSVSPRSNHSNTNRQQQFTVVKLTKSGQEMYEIVKKCIQETWRLLDARYYSELTKSVYKTVVTQMIYLVQVYSSAITSELNERAPKQLTTYRKSIINNNNNNNNGSRRSRKHRRNSSKNNSSSKPPPIMENEQFAVDLDDKKVKPKSLGVPNLKKKSHHVTPVPTILNESQMLSLIANVYYVSEDLLNRISHRYQKLFNRQIPELELFSHEQQKLYCAQFNQFGQKFLFKWINNKLGWVNDTISPIYSARNDISIITRQEIASWSVSSQMLNFVRYIVNLRLEIDKYLGSNRDITIIRDGIDLLLNELYLGDYIPTPINTDKNDNNILITPYGLNLLYLDFRFLMITLHNFMTTNSKNLCNNICEKAKKYVNFKYNLKINVDWKLMHTLGMKLQYKALTGDELDVLNKSQLSDDLNDNYDINNNNNQNKKKSARKNSGSKKRTSLY